MILSFKTKFKDGKPTYFIDKIWDGLLASGLGLDWFDSMEFLRDYSKKFNAGWDIFSGYAPKITTIRKDEKNRWKAGVKIHFTVFNRTKNSFRFAPVIKCKSVQKIEIRYTLSSGKIGSFECVSVIVDGRNLNYDEIETLAKNDGFDSFNHFIKWFNTDFTGKIIHWTELKY